MNFPASLSDQLSALTDAVDDPGTDLTTILGVLVDDLTAAIPSFLGLTMTLHRDGQPVTLTAIDPGDANTAQASLQLPLDPLAGAGPGSTVTFYAANAGAFVDLAADTRHAYGLDGQVKLDRHLPSGSTQHPAPAPAGGREMSNINRAIGVLIDQGALPDEARAELQRRAAAWHLSEPDAAARILRSIVDPGHPARDPAR